MSLDRVLVSDTREPPSCDADQGFATPFRLMDVSRVLPVKYQMSRQSLNAVINLFKGENRITNHCCQLAEQHILVEVASNPTIFLVIWDETKRPLKPREC